MDEAKRARLGRLKWHCRRALLELDIVLARYWAQQGDDLDDKAELALTRLLALEDHDLWELVSGRASTQDPELNGLAETLRSLTPAARPM